MLEIKLIKLCNLNLLLQCPIWVFEGFCKQLLEQFHSGQFLISRSRFTIEDINLLLLISQDILRQNNAHGTAYVGKILKDSLKMISTEPIGQVASEVPLNYSESVSEFYQHIPII